MIIEFTPDLLPSFAELHSEFAAVSPGIIPFAQDHWEVLFSQPWLYPSSHVFARTSSDSTSPGKLLGFAWIYPRLLPSHVFLRGPYAAPGFHSTLETVVELIEHALSRARKFNASYIEGRSLHPEWAEAYDKLGFKRLGAYERWSLSPLKGMVTLVEPPGSGAIRNSEGPGDIPTLMGLFNLIFRDHWDFVPSTLTNWNEMVSGEAFKPELLNIVVIDAKPVGYVFGQISGKLPGDVHDVCYLVSIGILKEHRASGWGRALLSNWLRKCYSNNIRAVDLDVDEANDSAKALYGSFGFRKVRTEEVYRKYIS